MIDTDCTGCIYAQMVVDDDDEDILFKCRRYPAQIFSRDEDTIQAFPDAVTRCGEFKDGEEQISLEMRIVELEDFNRRLIEELAKHGWGDMHYGSQPQDPNIVALLDEGGYRGNET